MAYPDYGPSRPEGEADLDYTEFNTRTYLTGYAAKMRYDIEKLFRLYSGKQVRIFQLNSSGERCTTCTDSITGAVILTNCPECNGTGYTEQYTSLGDYWALADIGPGVHMATAMGNTENTRTGTDRITLVGAPLLTDRDLLVFVATKTVYKLVDSDPAIVGMGGEVITQVCDAAFLTAGSKEYDVIDW